MALGIATPDERHHASLPGLSRLTSDASMAAEMAERELKKTLPQQRRTRRELWLAILAQNQDLQTCIQNRTECSNNSDVADL